MTLPINSPPFWANSGENWDSELRAPLFITPDAAAFLIPELSIPGPKESSGCRMESFMGASMLESWKGSIGIGSGDRVTSAPLFKALGAPGPPGETVLGASLSSYPLVGGAADGIG